MSTKRTAQDARRAALERISTKGLEVAVEAAIAVAGDAKAQHSARAAAAGLLFRASGLGGFGKTDEAASTKEPWEMTADELSRAADEARAELAARRPSEDDEEEAGVFD